MNQDMELIATVTQAVRKRQGYNPRPDKEYPLERTYTYQVVNHVLAVLQENGALKDAVPADGQ